MHMIIPIAFLIAVAILLTTFITVTTLTNAGDFKSYRETYKALATGGHVKKSEYGGQIYYQNHEGARNEIIKFENGSIKLLNRGYIHADSPVTWMSPYTLYYQYKFDKLFKKMETQEDETAHYNRYVAQRQQPNTLASARERRRIASEADIQRRLTSIQRYWDVPTGRAESNKPKEFKFLTKNQ